MDDIHGDREVRRANAVLLGLASIYVLLEWIPGVIGEYGYFIDEFYFVACSNHLALGYVDHPPLSIFLLWLVRAVAGDSLVALRFVPALAGGTTVWLTGMIARRLGADHYGQALAAGAMMVGSIYHITFGYYSMNAFSVVLWASCFWILVEIEQRDEPRLWIPFGALAGLALENKHTFVLLLAGLAVGMVLTRARRHLTGRWLWTGGAIAVLLLLPNLIWQAAHGWPSIEFYRNADLYKNIPTPPLEVISQQVLTMNPGALPVWLAGLVFFLATARGRRFRHLGWIYLALLVLLLIGQKSRPDRIADAYIVLFAGGGALLSDLSRRLKLRGLRWVLPVVLLLSGAALAPVGLPLLPPRLMADYTAALSLVPQIEKGEGKRSRLPQWFADRLGWEQLVDDVAAVAAEMTAAERERAIVFAPSYGQAGAIELLGRGRDLPPAYASQNSFFHWGPPDDPVDAAIVIGPFREDTVRRLFDEVKLVRLHDCDWCMTWRDLAPIWLARGQKELFADAWPHLKHYE
jgi:hypothetical protein